MNPKKYKGGNRNLHSGGIGPDDYLFKRNSRGARWVSVYIRHGQGKQAEYWEDLDALSIILKNCERVCMPDLARIYHPDMPSSDAATFLYMQGKSI